MNNDKVLNSYYGYYKGVLKEKSLSEEQVLSEMKDRFNNLQDIKIAEWGRTLELKGILIPKDETHSYIIPLKTSAEIISMVGETLGENLLREHNWVIPPYIQKRIIYDLLKKKQQNDVAGLFKETYTPAYFTSQLTSTYKNITLFNNHLSLINEAIECFFNKHIAAAITLLLTIIEGIAREYCNQNNLSYAIKGSSSPFETVLKHGKKQWRDNVLLYNYKERKKLIIPSDYVLDNLVRRIDEAMDMFISFETYGLDYLYKSDSDHTLNRHSILHGINKEYFIPINFYRLFSFLEMLAVVVSLDPMPKDCKDEEAFKLFIKYELLDELSKYTKDWTKIERLHKTFIKD
ncbi:hypothetical protein [Bacillus cereus]|uniref:hypothetical protein n=1 Tax=Bacillus cereus TaxID=1396 RepID=UPI0039806E58